MTEKTIDRYSDLVEFFESGCKPIDEWKIGTEHEKFGFIKKTLESLSYDGEQSILSILKGLVNFFPPSKHRDKNLIA